MKDCIGNDINVGDFIIYVVHGGRNPALSFGWVDDIVDKRQTVTRPSDGYTYTTGDITVKITQADAKGAIVTKKHTDYGEWDPVTCSYPDREVIDTGKPVTTRLNASENNSRFLVSKPL